MRYAPRLGGSVTVKSPPGCVRVERTGRHPCEDLRWRLRRAASHGVQPSSTVSEPVSVAPEVLAIEGRRGWFVRQGRPMAFAIARP